VTLAALVSAIKRQARYGDFTNTGDQATADVITAVNARRSRFWRRYNWDWLLQPISLAVVSGQTDYTITTSPQVGDIIILAITGGDPPVLTRITAKRYYQWRLQANATPAQPAEYFLRGLDASGNPMITIWPTPSSAVTVLGFGKAKIADYAVADIATNNGLEYFPKDTHEILITGGLADISKIQGDMAAATAFNAEFERQLNQLVPEVTSEGDQEIAAYPPDRYIFRKRNSGGTSVVV
jgi:hypothetical protein